MAVKRRQPTFAEIVDDVRSEPSTPPSGRHAIRPGQLNKAGEFFDLAGRPLHLEGRVTAEDAAELIVNHAALVAYEGCGCGGWSHCRPSWASPAQVTALTVTRDLDVLLATGAENGVAGMCRKPSLVRTRHGSRGGSDRRVVVVILKTALPCGQTNVRKRTAH
jgi:hypothetical protein